GRREQPAAAPAPHADSGVAQQTNPRLYTRLGALLAPHGDIRHAVAGAGLDDLLETRPLRGDLVQAEPVKARASRPPRACRPHPLSPSPFGRGGSRGRHSSPASARTRLIRLAAPSGSASNPAASASRNSSARCGTERQLSAPPIMRKCGWWPFRKARNTMPLMEPGLGASMM